MPAAGTDRCTTAPRTADEFLRSFTTAFGRSCRGQVSMRKGELQQGPKIKSIQLAYGVLSTPDHNEKSSPQADAAVLPLLLQAGQHPLEHFRMWS